VDPAAGVKFCSSNHPSLDIRPCAHTIGNAAVRHSPPWVRDITLTEIPQPKRRTAALQARKSSQRDSHITISTGIMPASFGGTKSI